MGSNKESYLESLTRDGFVLIPSLLTPSQLETLRAAATDVISFARSGSWPYVRTLPKQFPPWKIEPGANPAADGIWGVQFLMHPSLPHAQTFIKNYFSSAIIDVIKELLQCEDEDLVLELFNLLVRPDHDFELVWHRDDIPATATAEEEVERLKEPAWHAQWNLALFDDESLIVVPGSHTRARTDVERNAAPKEKGIPDEIKVQMKAGDVVFYNNNIFHRGAYNSKVERMTLHGSMGHVEGSNLRARNVLQHGIGEWVGQIDLSGLDEGERKRAEGMRERLVKMGSHTGEYSLEG
ncbi:Phytanoyl-CoA dioxygenase [Venustampulla echinocandica]|uniref:Phytanoyl-CoA dioxygenase n=1 Tax=Venustampulla echinocandica TaxID=2656787 RepID=A0A370U1U7_9HELO|nr:Phytanoyl-CoA dioxygenase [Venustampulla echinocandica]RDL41760.1 Phytanoyl-CoA dioxygenase [Venustampulla echinocandica]